jgi:hypothetical protein
LPNRDTNGLKYKNQLKLGMDELQWLQDEADERRRMLLLGAADQLGWFGAWWPHGQGSLGWQVNDPGDNGILRLQLPVGGAPFIMQDLRATTTPMGGIAPNGRPVQLDIDDNATLRDIDDEALTVPDDGVWYTLVAVPVLQSRAPGRLTMTAGSAVVTGVRTDFTRYADGTDTRATRFRISAADGDSAAGNEGTYRFVTITDATTATLDRPAVQDESGVHFRVVGDYFGAVPADPDIHSVAMTVWELRARTVTLPTDALIAYDVMRDTGIQPGTFLIDRRHAQPYRPTNSQIMRRWTLTPVLEMVTAAPNIAVERRRDTILAIGGDDILFAVAAPCNTGGDTSVNLDSPGGLLAVCGHFDGATFDLRVREYVPWMRSPWRNPNGGGTINIDTGVDVAGQTAILNLPSGCGFTHVFFAGDGDGKVQQYRSDDNGLTWDGPTLIWDPDANAAGDEVHDLAACLTRRGRIVLVGEYIPSGGQSEIRYIHSDDYTDTWETTSDAGVEIESQGALDRLSSPSIVEDDFGNLWTAWGRDVAGGGEGHVRLVRGAAPNDPVPDSEVPAGGWAVTEEISGSTGTVNQQPNLVAAPDGCIIVFHQVHDSIVPLHQIFATVTSRGRPIHKVRISTIDAANGTDLTDVAVDAHGVVHLLRTKTVVTPFEAVDETFHLQGSARAGFAFPD